jgi:hypothetical protein
MFMALVVHAGETWKGMHVFSPTPQLEMARDVYQEAVGDRLQSFPPTVTDFHDADSVSPLSPFQHKVRYDAKSVFWLFVWWSLQIRPTSKNENEGEGVLPTEYWNYLTSERYGRSIFIYRGFPQDILHSEYKPLEGLLEQMDA